MSDEEGDLEALTALLEDSENDEETSSQSLSKDNTGKEEKKKDDMNDPTVDEECSLEEITSFLEGSDSEEEVEDTETHKLVKEKNMADSKVPAEITENIVTESKVPTEITENNGTESKVPSEITENNGTESKVPSEITENNGRESKVPSEISEIEARMLKMQEEMMALQAKLLKQKKLNSELSNSKEISHSTTKDDDALKQLKQLPKHGDGVLKEKRLSPKNDSVKHFKQSPKEDALKHKNHKNDQECDIINKKKKVISKREDPSLSSVALSSTEEENPFFGKDVGKAGSTKKHKNVDRNTKRNSPGSQEKISEDVTAQSLFGDSDSDWDELDGDKPWTLSDTGQEIRQIMKKGEKERVSHANKSDVQALRDKAVKPNSWKDRPFLGQKQIDPPPKHSSKENDMPSITDPFSNIRIVNPKVSSLDMKMKMQDRKLFKLSTLNTRPSADLQGNWVTIGVVIYKSEPRTSASGKNYCLWKLSDLQNCDQVITFFLFGEVFKQHWKNEVSTVVGLLNPNPMDKAEKASKDVAFTVNHPHQILVMGHSKDLGKCAGTNRAGNACTNIINKQHGEFCTYHVQAAYKRSSSKRTELQGGAAVTPKNHVYNQKKNQQGFFFYGGETFTNMRPVSSNSSNLVTVKNLQAKQAAMGKGKLTTMSLHNIAASDNKRLQQLQDKDNALVDLLSTPTVGSMNMIKHLMKKENMEKDQQDDKKKPAIQSISARDLLRQHKEVMRQKLRPSSTGSTPPVNPLKVAPVLGKGCNDGLINLDAPRVPKLSAMKAEQAKRKAILQIQEKGGIQKEDPNAVRKKSSPEARERILKRIREDVDQENKSKSAEEPPKKKSKLLGNIDENSEEFKALMKTKSRHTGALKEAEKEIEEKYFMELEKKERYEEKMSSIMEMKCTVFTCKICNYTSFKTSDRCKEERHPITKVQATKRFFKCKKCGKRTHSIHKLPQEPCRGCGDNNYERTSMLQERKGPKLPHENLCIRGDEAKFLNSMDQKSYLNL